MSNNNLLATECFYQIRDLIVSGELLPGEKLKGEYLKHRLNSGLSPIREALSRLVETGLVEFRDKVGFRVAVLTVEKIQDLLKTHAKIECLLLAESIESGDDEWEARVMAALYKLAKVENGEVLYSQWLARNNEFHNALVSGCNIEGLNRIRSQCVQLKEWYTGFGKKERKDDLIRANHHEHAKIVELAINRKNESACIKLYKHMTTGIDGIINNLQNILH